MPFRVAAVQAAPVFLDREATVDRTIELTGEAARNGARLLAFPETWIPGYPWWIWLDNPAEGLRFVRSYHDNSVEIGSESLDRICRAAREHAIYVVLGASERCRGSLYISQFFISAEGRLLAVRRKLKPTHVERTVFGDGYGDNLFVLDTPLGRVGGLCCWEHLQPLSRYALFAQDEQIHVGAWPSFSLYPGRAYSLGPQLNLAVSSVYAAEGQCYFLAPCGVVSPSMIDLLADTGAKRELLQPGGGHAMIFGPDGAPLCEALPPDSEGLLFADVDPGHIRIAKSFADPAGHYSRPDVTRLLLNRAPVAPVEMLQRGGEDPAEVDNHERQGDPDDAAQEHAS